MSNDGKSVATLAHTGKIEFWSHTDERSLRSRELQKQEEGASWIALAGVTEVMATPVPSSIVYSPKLARVLMHRGKTIDVMRTGEDGGIGFQLSPSEKAFVKPGPISVTADGSFAAAITFTEAGASDCVDIWKIPPDRGDKSPIASVEVSQKYLRDVDFLPDGRLLVTALSGWSIIQRKTDQKPTAIKTRSGDYEDVAQLFFKIDGDPVRTDVAQDGKSAVLWVKPKKNTDASSQVELEAYIVAMELPRWDRGEFKGLAAKQLQIEKNVTQVSFTADGQQLIVPTRQKPFEVRQVKDLLPASESTSPKPTTSGQDATGI